MVRAVPELEARGEGLPMEIEGQELTVIAALRKIEDGILVAAPTKTKVATIMAKGEGLNVKARHLAMAKEARKVVHHRDPEEPSHGMLPAALVTAARRSAVRKVDDHRWVDAPRLLVHPASEVGRLSVRADRASVADRHSETRLPRSERGYPKG